MDKVRLLPSDVQGLVPIEAALSSFTTNRSPIVLDTACMELEKRKKLFDGPALVRDFLWVDELLDFVQLRTRTSGIRNNKEKCEKFIRSLNNLIWPIIWR
ncbi:hypothetical protein AVEN_98892-1 [Araneus ventricosus]|uniref:Uncharacterized protein n=1 Tax=Araneus ventricosus TaxID=182803 RepID=A0A4Y2FVM5_ARAVE|nr:hypothetical protein AVEN_98892-1 [Araneus ventricosus]